MVIMKSSSFYLNLAHSANEIPSKGKGAAHRLYKDLNRADHHCFADAYTTL